MYAFYISRQGRQEGPHSLELIEDKLKSEYLTPHDYIYDSKTNEWILLSRFKLTQEICQKFVKKEELTQPLEMSPIINNWYLLKGENQSGPYFYSEIVQMLEDKKAFEYDYVWTPTMTSWERISECENFEAEKLKPFLRNQNTKCPIQFRRKEARVEIGVSLVIHNNKKLINGNSFELSATGASIEITGNEFSLSELLVVHFRPSKRVPAFNVHCEVISYTKILTAINIEKYRIGVRFIKVNNYAKTVIREIINLGAA